MRLFTTILFFCLLCMTSSVSAQCGDGYCDYPFEDGFNCPLDCGGICGNGICDGSEDACSCPNDCGLTTCGDGCCGGSETNATCPGDCPPFCGDGICNGGETNGTCPGDCPSVCGNGLCESGESQSTCPQDCGTLPSATYLCYTGIPLMTPNLQANGCCNINVTGYGAAAGYNCSSSDCANCPSSCGNGICDGTEDCSTCPTDCGVCPAVCGDGNCDPGETCCNCNLDCGGGYCGGNHGMLCAIARPASTISPANTQGQTQWRHKSGSLCQATMNGPGVYSYVVSYSHCTSGSCPANFTQQYIVVGQPVISISSTNGNSFCSGAGNTTLTANCVGGDCNNLTYQWSNGGGTGNSMVISGLATSTNYSVIVTNHGGNGCQVTATYNISINPPPSPAFNGGPTESICSGGNTTLSLTSSYPAYTWSTGANSPTINVSSAGTYSVTVTDGNGCQGSATKTVSVGGSISPTVTAANPSLCSGVTSVGTAAPYSSYLWSNSSTSPNINVPAGSYSVTVTDASGCTGTGSITINNVGISTSWTTSPVTICAGGNSTVSVTCLSNCAGVSYVWDNGLPPTDVQIVSPTTTTTYRVTSTNSSGCSSVGSMTVNVNPSPSPTIAPTSLTLCAGGSGTFVASGGNSYVWSNGANTASNTVSISGSYTVTVTDGNGCTASTSGTATANPLPTPAFNGGSSETICTGGNTTLSLTAAYSAYSWSNSSSSSTINVSPASNTVYTVTVTDGNGCQSTASKTVTVGSGLTATITPASPAICAGGSVVLGTSNAYNTYQWSTGANTSTITATATGTYSVTVSDASGCTGTGSTSVGTTAGPTVVFNGGNNETICTGGNLTLSLNAAYSAYSWSNSATSSTINVSPASTTVYTVTVTDAGGCQGIASKTVTVGSGLTATITPASPSFCAGGSVTLGTSVAYSSYLWSTGANTPTISTNATGNVGVTVTDASGCSGTGLVSVSLGSSPTVSFNGGSSETICTGSTTTISLASAYSGYMWSNGATTASITANAAGTYTVTITAAGGCTATGSKSISLGAGLTPSFVGGGSQALCAGASRTLSLSSAYSSYLWSTGATTANIVVSTANSYVVTVSNGGCSGTATVSVAAVSNPSVTATVSGSPICYNGTATGTASASGGLSPYTYSWQSGGTSSSNNFTVPGSGSNYTQSVTVTDANGCTASAAGAYTVTSCSGSTTLTATDTVVCAGTRVVLTVNNPPSLPSYSWSTGQTGVSSISVSPSSTTNYTVSVYSNGSLVNTLSKNILVPATAMSVSLSKPSLCGTTDVASISVGVGSACASCAYTIYNLSGTVVGTGTGLPAAITTSSPSLYYGRLGGCSNISNLVSLSLTNINAALTAVPDTVLCGSGDSSSLVASGNCSGCNYVWRRNGTNVAGATSNSLRVGQNGLYLVSISDGSGCASTAQVSVSATSTRISGFSIPSPLALGAASVDLNTVISFSPSAPSPAGSFAGTGVSGSNFVPSLAGQGTHYVSYNYTENGCLFSAVDTVQVVANGSAATFSNLNADGADSIYANSEACIGDTLVISLSNYLFNPNQVEFANGMGGFLTPTAVFNSSVAVDGSGKYNGTLMVVVPVAAKTGTIRLKNGATVSNLGAIVVNNPDIILSGLPNPSCSNGNYGLSANPSGGTFSALYGTVSQPSLISGSNFLTNLVSGYTAGARAVTIRYSYVPRYGNGAGGACPAVQKDSQTTMYDVRIDTVSFYPISSSETATRLDSLLNSFLPASSLSLNPVYSGVGVSGTTPNFFYNAQQAGVGTRQIYAEVSNNGCVGRDTGTIQVINRPVLTGLMGQYCNTSANDTILRDPAFPYSTGAGVTNNEWSLSASNYSGSFTPQCSAAPGSYCYLFSPNLGTGGFVVLTTVYRNYPVAGRSYIVGRTQDTILIGSGSSVQIQTRDTLYCAGSGFRPIQVSPNTGSFVIRQLNGASPSNVDFSAVVSNGTVVANVDSLYRNESGNVRYRMVYTFGAAGCSNGDSLEFVIPRPADASFSMQFNNTGSYCRLDQVDTFLPSLAAQNLANSSLFTINNIPTFNRSFNPNASTGVFVGQNTIIHTISNSFGCVSVLRDTFVVNNMPTISFSSPAPRYCVYDAAFSISATSSPSTGTGQLSFQREQQPFAGLSNPATVSPATLLDTFSQGARIRFRYSHTDGNGCTSTGFDSTIVYPRPVVSLAPLQPSYCADPFQVINLSPNPSGGTISSSVLSGGSSNVNPGAGIYIPNQITTEAVIYNYTSPITGCQGEYRDTVDVDPASAAIVSVTTATGLNVFCYTGDTIKIIGTRSVPGSVTFTSNSATANGGIVAVRNGIGSDTAYFVPNQATTGQVVITYALTVGGCSKISQRTLTINRLPDLRLEHAGSAPTTDSSICEYGRADAYVYDYNSSMSNALLTNSYTITGAGYYPAGGANPRLMFFYTDSLPAMSRVGMQYAQVRYTDGNGCVGDLRDSILVRGNPRPVINGLNSSYCVGSPADTVFGIPSNGVWTYTNINNNPVTSIFPSGVQSPSTVININSGGPGSTGAARIRYTVNSNGCSNEIEQIISVNPALDIALTAVPPSVCSNASPFVIRASTSSPVGSISYAYFPNILAGTAPIAAAIFNDTMFNPAPAGGNNGVLRAAYNDPSTGCTDTSYANLVVVNATSGQIVFEEASGPNDNVYCVDTLSNQPALMTANVEGNFSSGNGWLQGDSIQTDSAYLRINRTGADVIRFIAITGSGSLTCYDTSYHQVQVNGLPPGLALSGLRNVYCQGTDNLQISAFPAPPNPASYGNISIRELSTGRLAQPPSAGNQLSLPSLMGFGLGAYSVTYRYTDEFSCSSSYIDTFELHPSPVAGFSQDGFCVGDDLILTANPWADTVFNDSVVSWAWLFNSQTAPDSNVAVYPNQRIANSNYSASLTLRTSAGCIDKYDANIPIYRFPVAEFRAVGGCQGAEVRFEPESSGLIPGVDTLSYALWNFGQGPVQAQLDSAGTEVQVAVNIYQQPGVYTPSLTLINNGYCQTTDTIRFIISPTVALYDIDTLVSPPSLSCKLIPYSNDFESTTSTPAIDWSPAQNNSIWHRGWADTIAPNTPNAATINTFFGNSLYKEVWTTSRGKFADLTPYPDFNSTEPQWLYSPCFDFSYSQRPMIKFDYISDMRPTDGAALEYYDEDLGGWRRFGRKDQGINWYNEAGLFPLFELPDFAATIDQSDVNSLFMGWSEDLNPQWRKARYRLDQFKGQRSVRFRMVFAASFANDGVGTNEIFGGFAFDNVWVGERERGVLVEHFADRGQPNLPAVNNQLYNQVFSPLNYNDVSLVQYHTNPNDPLYQAAQSNINARVLAAGVDNSLGNAGAAVVNGDSCWSGLTDSINDFVLEAQMLEDPFFTIRALGDDTINQLSDTLSLLLNISNDSISVSAVIKAEKTITDTIAYQLNVAVTEHFIPFTNGFSNDSFMSVFRQFCGTDNDISYYFFKPWTAGEEIVLNQASWTGYRADIPNINTSHLVGVVWIEQRFDGVGRQGANYKVLQAVTTRDVNARISTGIDNPQLAEQAQELFELNLYPNPAQDLAYIEFKQPLSQDYQLRLLDLQGRTIYQSTAQQGQQRLELNTEALPQGMYIVSLQDQQRSTYVQRKLVIIRP